MDFLNIGKKKIFYIRAASIMNRTEKKKTRQPNPVSKASIFSKLTFWWGNFFFNKCKNNSTRFTHLICLFRWLKPIFTIGLSRSIEEDDVYAVTNSMQSERNTEAFDKLWQLELEKKNPSILRVMFKLHGPKVLTCGLLYSIGETLAK